MRPWSRLNWLPRSYTTKELNAVFAMRHLEVACKQKHFDSYSAAAARIKQDFNHELRIIPKSDLHAEIGSDIYYGGMVDETSVSVNPAQYVAGLAQASRTGRRSFVRTRSGNWGEA